MKRLEPALGDGAVAMPRDEPLHDGIGPGQMPLGSANGGIDGDLIQPARLTHTHGSPKNLTALS
ncbi:MAG TPA: hypothetical protein VFK65_03660 [Candidatus Binatia bacterium]|nr:hypothetical protein [Candidatus Binatia bacterium]